MRELGFVRATRKDKVTSKTMEKRESLTVVTRRNRSTTMVTRRNREDVGSVWFHEESFTWLTVMVGWTGGGLSSTSLGSLGLSSCVLDQLIGPFLNYLGLGRFHITSDS
ncbi:unnamed protein product [Microthlaspi erraticum]|uniref:Uncharacterized protein n=1 Tax=Microthlaspi erraticum TaxID=1685480 RepID=A0A6D2JZI4_9BRAS|nr:unnamed protein product [Microthlaspi erraticum]